MPREDYLNLDVNKVISDISNSWISKNDFIINRDTTNYKISSANKGQGIGKKLNEEHKKKLKKAASLAATGRIFSPETLLKMSLSHKGYKPTPESIEKSRQKRKGMKRKPESIEKGRLTQTGRKLSDATKAKISKAITGIKRSDEHIAKLVACHKGKKRSSEAVAKTIATKTANKILNEVLGDKAPNLNFIYNGKRYQTIADAARKLGIPVSTFRARYKKSLKNNE